MSGAKYFPIVVAIIAVLVAIAVPLFVGQLSKAEESVKNANISAVRGAAVNLILTDSTDDHDYIDTTGDYYDKDAKCWYATAKVSSNGDISELKIPEGECPADLEDGAKSGNCKKEADGSYTVAVKISDLTVTPNTP